jgi:hypothetical protein
VLDVFRVFGRNDRWDLSVHGQPYRGFLPRIDPDKTSGTKEVPGFTLKMLALTLVRGKLENSAVAQVESLVSIEQRLHPVLTWRYLRQTLQRITEHPCVEKNFVSWAHTIGVYPEHQLRLVPVAHLETGFRNVVVRDVEENPTILSLDAMFFWKRDSKSEWKMLRTQIVMLPQNWRCDQGEQSHE